MRHSGKIAASCFVAALVLLAGSACPAEHAVLAGIGTTERMGESAPALTLAADARYGILQAEAWWTGADKVESGDGWASRLGLDLWAGTLSIGASWAHRETSAWSKDVLFVRASAQQGPLRLLAEVAPGSRLMEAYAEARLRLHPQSRIDMEPRAWVGWHTRAEELGGYAWGLSILLGVGGSR
jgi:hypothetical protein